MNAIDRTLEILGWRTRAYRLTFPKGAAAPATVLADMARYAHLHEECPHKDPFEIGKWLGKQEFFLRIQRHIHLSPEELFAVYQGARIQPKEN